MGRYVEIGTIRTLDRLPAASEAETRGTLFERVVSAAKAARDAWGGYARGGDADRREALEDALADAVEAIATIAAAEGLDLAAGLDRRRAANAEAGLVSADDGIDVAHRPWHMPLGIVLDEREDVEYELLFDMSGRQEFWVRCIDSEEYGTPVHMPITWRRVLRWLEDGDIRCDGRQRREIEVLAATQEAREAEAAAHAEDNIDEDGDDEE